MKASTSAATSLDAMDAYEQTVKKRFNGGAECTPYTMDLLRLADAIADSEQLTAEQIELQTHLEKCSACKSTVKSAVWFAQHPVDAGNKNAESPASTIAEINATDEQIIVSLKNAQQKVGYLALTLADYIKELMHAAGISDDGAVIRAFDLPRDHGLGSLNRMTKRTVEAATVKLGLDEPFVNLAVEYAAAMPVSGLFLGVQALKSGAKQRASLDVVGACQCLTEAIEALCTTDAGARQRVRECRESRLP